MIIICSKCKSQQELSSNNIIGQKGIDIEFSRIYDISEIQIKCNNWGESMSQDY